jgi:hypothetical protein
VSLQASGKYVIDGPDARGVSGTAVSSAQVTGTDSSPAGVQVFPRDLGQWFLAPADLHRWHVSGDGSTIDGAYDDLAGNGVTHWTWHFEAKRDP